MQLEKEVIVQKYALQFSQHKNIILNGPFEIICTYLSKYINDPKLDDRKYFKLRAKIDQGLIKEMINLNLLQGP